jgi:hypothetical protein
MMHWLAMRRLSDKSAGPRVMEELMFGPPTPKVSLARKIMNFLTKLNRL